MKEGRRERWEEGIGGKHKRGEGDRKEWNRRDVGKREGGGEETRQKE